MDSDRIQMGLKRIPRLNLNRATWDINVFGFDVYGISFFFLRLLFSIWWKELKEPDERQASLDILISFFSRCTNARKKTQNILVYGAQHHARINYLILCVDDVFAASIRSATHGVEAGWILSLRELDFMND